MPTITGTAGSEILTGTAGDDVINDDAGGSDTLRGLGGNDILHVGRGQHAPVNLLRLEGGDGDDLLDYYVFNASQGILDGGAGVDTFRLWAVAGPVQITTGAGADIIDFGRLNPTWGGALTVTDFTGGIGGDRISWGSLPFGALNFLTGWGGGNPFADGYLQLTQVGAHATLWMDLDGAAGPGAAFALLTFLNTQTSSLTAWNLGFDPAGGPIPGLVINGTTASETLQGTAGNDIISGLEGDDFLFGNAGDDQLYGGQGDDVLEGGQGDDVLEGGDGNDRLSDHGLDFIGTSYGDDILNGGAGDDYISVARWSQVADVLSLSGGAGSDELRVIGDGAFSATLDGGADADRLYLDGHIRANLTLTTGTGADTIHLGMIVEDTQAITVTDFTGGAGGDALVWGSALDFYLIGWNHYNPFQLGFARLVQDGTSVLLQLDRDGSAGAHAWKTLFIFQNTAVASFTAENLLYSPAVVPGQLFSGGEGADVFTGTDGNDVMQGWGGDDVLRGGGGDDDLQGGSGRDILIGGAGGDRMDGGHGGEQAPTYLNGVYTGGGDLADFREADRGVTVDLSRHGPQNTGQGLDTLSGFEDVFGGAYDDVITGDRYSPGLIMGNDGDDVLAAGLFLVGGDGDDVLIATFLCTMDGGAGEDTAVFDAPRSEYVIAAGPDGTVTVTRFGSLTYITRDVEFLRFSDGLYDINGERAPTVIVGTPNADVLTGGDGADILNGGGGDDILDGGGGDDVINGGSGNDIINGGAGTDRVVVSGAYSDYRLLMNGDGFILKGPDGRDSLTSVESIRFGDGRVLELNRMYGPEIPAGAWADGRIPEYLLSDGTRGEDRPLVLPGEDGGRTGRPQDEAPLVLPGVDDEAPWVGKRGDGPEVLPGMDDWTPAGAKHLDQPNVLPELEEPTLFGFEPAITPQWSGHGERVASPSAETTQAAGLAVRGLIYVVDDQRRLLSIDPATHQVNFIAQLSLLMSDIAIAPDGTAYGLSSGTWAGLHRINLTTGALQPIDSTHVRGGNALTIDALGQAYIGSSQSSLIYASSLSVVGGNHIGNESTGRASAGDLALLDGLLYLSTTGGRIDGFSPSGGPLISSGTTGGTDITGLATYEGQAYAFANRTLYSINLVTGALTNPFTFAADTVGAIYGAASYDFGQSGIALLGGSADETLTGTERDDVLNGADGADYLSGGMGNDVLYGGAGDDILEGGAGADVLNGGWGSSPDTNDIAAYTTQVTANLADPSQNTGDAAGDTYIMIRSLSGSAFDDVLTSPYGNLYGNGGDDRLTGGTVENSLFGGDGDDILDGDDGDDILDGGDGDDILDGGDGDDILDGGSGNNTLNGGAGNDTAVVSGAFSDYRLLQNGDGFILKGPDGRDSLTSVESIRFGDGRVLELNRMYGPEIPAGAWADGRIPEYLLSDGTRGEDRPLVLPGVGDPGGWSGKQGDRPEVLPGPADDDFLIGKDAGQPQVMPVAEIEVGALPDLWHPASGLLPAAGRMALLMLDDTLAGEAGHDISVGLYGHDPWG